MVIKKLIINYLIFNKIFVIILLENKNKGSLQQSLDVFDEKEEFVSNTNLSDWKSVAT